jgi:hypothetical protein
MIIGSVVGDNINDNDTKCTLFTGWFDGHGDAAVRRNVHRPMDYNCIQGYTRSHWMPPAGKCLRRTAPTDAMVVKIK